ncbi:MULTISPECIES: DUF5305 domain-containing protein [unclassified Haloarcula]|uniref:DUF5305 domain-containing protein n=1 Tax=unclassified Haloarcula TaxID=2624677 RepID=UPI001CD9656F|nr:MULTISPECIES: DUF5305 domain-containing protein [unclassified Haloarcula]
MNNLLSVSVRSALNRWFVLVLLVALGLALAGGYVTYDSHVDGAETVVEQQTTGTWTVESEFEHGATVTRDTEVFSAGEELTNRSLYFTTASPELEGTYTVSHDNTDGNPAVTSTDLSLVIRAVEERNGNQVVHWETRDSLETIESVETEDGGATATTVNVDIPMILNRTEAIQNDLGAAPGQTEVLLVADTTVESSVDGETFTDTRTDRIEIVPGRSVYRVSTTTQDASSYEATEQVTRTIEPTRLELYGGPGLCALGLLSMAFLGTARWRGWLAVTDRERARNEFERARDDFDEWISTARIPDADDRTPVPTDSLVDLVDIAIDSDRRVLEDGERYAVLVDSEIYTYTAPPAVDPLASPATGDTDPVAEDTEQGTASLSSLLFSDSTESAGGTHPDESDTRDSNDR